MITCWWEGLPGLDWRYLPDDEVFGDRMTAITCAMRVHGVTHPTAGHGPGREVENTADLFFTWVREERAERGAWHGYVRRLSLAMACASAQGMRPADVARHAGWFRDYLTKPPDKRGGWV